MAQPEGYIKGQIDALQLWGRVCGRKSSCAECLIGPLRGQNVTCQDFATQFPQKMLSILKEMDDGQITYYEEYCLRFPENSLPVEILAQCACRKAVFEGYVGCEADESQCVNCWNSRYEGDRTVQEDTSGLTNI